MRASIGPVRLVPLIVLALVAAATIGGGAWRWSGRAPAPSPAAAPGGGCAAPATPRQLRGMWLTTVNNIDFPSRPGLSAAAVQAEYRRWLDLAQAQRHNAIFVHVRPSGDALWPSTFAPWSEWLTGRRDNRDPGWDPLRFMIDEAHARNLQFHAWFNPYRGSQPAPAGAGASIAALAPGHPLKAHPEWAVVHPKGKTGRLYFDPGQPAARRFVEDSILDAVTRYDLDGVHFDDFFYPYPKAGEDFGDDASFAAHGGGLSRADWRRANVNTFVRETGERIRAVKPWVQYGISPFGIWRNTSTDPEGSATRGLQSHDAIYADTRAWVRERWLDYVVPQLYWHIGFDVADYATLLRWWTSTVEGTGVKLYIGQADYRVGEKGPWSEPDQLTRQLALNRELGAEGSVHFSAKQIRADRLGAVTRYRDAHYAAPALPPVPARLVAPPAAPPRLTGATLAAPAPWAAYDARGTLVATGRGTAVDAPGAACVRVLDRGGNESAAAPLTP
ncbi:glycoside hydrolase family 10 protein [Spirilliplanes yamanashiensis]|uniref:Glycosyl hydrolase-like 10 domain-containing protein n=1 Tax=Spirilliplanes yamanashiensis TaxID=42233 RepID=A0A8J3YBN9_9ACTN|nr:family 10 glycosylhydrolase [Spirilliplanes yamanashiensis]MDP9817971.1 uncharacterized lipoprotein YddW (UPF0748 family) [Spirilliplanes yamanashiensis]GIJ04780.1 hypothetical protein Sya03_41320 [Spirilliplanes yamanashiensis]